MFGLLPKDPDRKLAKVFQMLAPLNSAFNPIVYSIFNPKVLDLFKLVVTSKGDSRRKEKILLMMMKATAVHFCRDRLWRHHHQ